MARISAKSRSHASATTVAASKSNSLIAILMSKASLILRDPTQTWLLGILLLNVEIVVNLFVISKAKYTEIDWIAYMQEVAGFINGTYDYMKLEGDTGPLVYPAGFVYIFSFFYYITRQGSNILLAQYTFMILYLINLYLVLNIYQKTQKCPPYVFLFMCLASYRVHSIFVLRLFNDPIAMIILYAAINFYLDKKWYSGSLLFSLAVSVKMNILLFAPGLLLLMLYEIGIRRTAVNLSICAAVQVVLGLPFLIANPSGYLIRSFDLSRQFFFKWTVNWRFVTEPVFVDRSFHILLLFLHLSILFCFAAYKWRRNIVSLFSLINFKLYWNKGIRDVTPDQFVTVMFTSNFIGMCFCRSLHYQFYIWYYHTLPFLLWATPYPTGLRLLVFGIIEMCWNTYPSTYTSSLCLTLCHMLTLVGLWHGHEEEVVILDHPPPSASRNSSEKAD